MLKVRRLSKVLTYILTILMSTGLGSCSKPTSISEVSGRYICKYPYGIEILILRKDGEYTQLIDLDSQTTPLIHEGKWSYLPSENTINLNDAIILDDNFGKLRSDYKTPTNGIWALTVKTIFGKVSLEWNPDIDYVFRSI
jgi:hypothetical protein